MPRAAGRWLIAGAVLASWAVPAFGAGGSCTRALGAPMGAFGSLKISGTQPAGRRLPVVPGHTYLIEVEERNDDARVEVLDPGAQTLARTDHPERRAGTRRTVVTAPGALIVVRVSPKDAARAAGTADIRLFDLAALRERPDCLGAVTALAEADADYAVAEDIATGHPGSATVTARDTFLRAAAGYLTAERALDSPADRQLRGEAVLALAGIEYFGLQEWAKAAEWAETAADLLLPYDPYRSALADALLAEAWIETGATGRARGLLQRLLRFHQERGEAYDTALQLTDIGLTYLYEGRYRECMRVSATSARLFNTIHEPLRRAQAWQNHSLCLWGMGRLPEALRGLEHSLKDIGPEPYPTIYVASVTNAALADYALGHFDDSLRLYDRALTFAEKIHSPRNEAYCLYGIGVNYYALGDGERAREYLERSLAIRSVALDRRGRLASLRALATVYAEQGVLDKALADDRDALSLAVAPSTIARIKIQLAAHTAAEGLSGDAMAQLDQVISSGVKSDPAIHAEALLRRGVLLRQTGFPQQAVSDLEAARPRLHAFGSVTEEFEADLELARAFRMTSQPEAALRAVDRALGHADALRLQTANPELRAQLQTPLRPAYDLKIELLRKQYEEALAAGRPAQARVLASAAFATAEAARARTFADVAAQRYPPALRQALGPEFRRREALYRELAGRRFALDNRLDASGSEDPRSRRLIFDIDELGREVDSVNTLLATRAGGATVAAHRERVGLPALGADTALIAYWLGSESAYAWMVLPHEVHWLRLSSPAAIGDEAEAFHRSLTGLVDIPLERRLKNSSALYDAVLRPLEPWVSDIRRWVIVPDGALDYVPFAALKASDTDSFVVMRHDIALTPAAWALEGSGKRERSASGRLLLVADPVYQADDPRLGVKRQSETSQASSRMALNSGRREYQRLRFTGEEAARVSALFAPADVDQLIGLNATRERLLSLEWSAYRFIHIATHGVVDARVPQLSALVLGSYDSRGEVADDAVRVADLSLRTLAADVVVLSACETALGKEVRSEGLVGLGSTMLARGAKAVVASLWPVADETGEQLMADFYRHLVRDSLSPEAALGAAMRSIVSRDRSTDPALWAAFQVSVAALQPSLPSGGMRMAKVAATPE